MHEFLQSIILPYWYDTSIIENIEKKFKCHYFTIKSPCTFEPKKEVERVWDIWYPLKINEIVIKINQSCQLPKKCRIIITKVYPLSWIC